MAEHSREQQHVVSPLEHPQQHSTRSPSPEPRPIRPISHAPQHSNTKLVSSVSERSMTSKHWQAPSTSKPKSGSHWWPWEWLCELLAIGSLAAMVLVLMYFHNKPQADWQQSYFTLNGLIAFLATLTKTGLIIPVSAAIGQRKWLRFLPNKNGNRRARRLGEFETFDEASRGSLGSAKLIFSLNAWDLACLGAFITIVSVFFSAITQNVLNTYDSVRDGRMVDLYAGRVQRSEAFNKTMQPKWTSINLLQQFRTDISTVAAIYNGIMSETIADVPNSCATGNCTWPTVPTLGICGACIDMQRQMQVTGSCSGTSGSIANEACNYTIPGGMTLSKPNALAEWNDTTPIFVAGSGSGYIFNQSDVVGSGYILNPMSFNFIGQTHSEFMHANRGDYPPGNETIFSKANVVAMECGLWTCLQAREITAFNGTVKDTLLDHRNGAKPMKKRGMTDVPLVFEDDPAFNVKNISDYNINDTSAWLAMEDTLAGALSGSITINANWDVGYGWAEIPSKHTGGLEGGMGSAADCVHAAWVYADDFEKWWARLAKSMTNNIRTNGFLLDEQEDMYAGTAWTEVTFIDVRWLWLIFPAVLVILSAAFLVATMVASVKSGLRPWKSFILPVLYTRLEEGLQEEWKQEYAQENSLLSEVKDRWTGLDSCDDTWVFRHIQKESGKVHTLRLAGDTSVDG